MPKLSAGMRFCWSSRRLKRPRRPPSKLAKKKPGRSSFRSESATRAERFAPVSFRMRSSTSAASFAARGSGGPPSCRPRPMSSKVSSELEHGRLEVRLDGVGGAEQTPHVVALELARRHGGAEAPLADEDRARHATLDWRGEVEGAVEGHLGAVTLEHEPLDLGPAAAERRRPDPLVQVLALDGRGRLRARRGREREEAEQRPQGRECVCACAFRHEGVSVRAKVRRLRSEN